MYFALPSICLVYREGDCTKEKGWQRVRNRVVAPGSAIGIASRPTAKLSYFSEMSVAARGLGHGLKFVPFLALS